jgi:16S rRNA G527 N7-methylase RsmG
MMGLSLAEGDALSLHDYEQILHNWNEAHNTTGEMDAPDPELAMAILEKANRDERLIH